MKVRFAVAPDGGAQEGARITAFADALEASGFDGVWLSDVPLAPVLDPLLGLALIAGRTRRLRLGANVVPLGRNPFLLAKELAQLDRLCDGRLLLSFVPGLDHPGEREVLGVDGATRGAVLEEALGLAAPLVGRRGGGASLGAVVVSRGRRGRPRRCRSRWRCGWAGAARRRWNGSGGSPTAGSAQRSRRRGGARRRASASSSRRRAPRARSTPSTSA